MDRLGLNVFDSDGELIAEHESPDLDMESMRAHVGWTEADEPLNRGGEFRVLDDHRADVCRIFGVAYVDGDYRVGMFRPLDR